MESRLFTFAWFVAEFPYQSALLTAFVDGGGIRGLSSLYILEALMEQIEREETSHARQHSYDPSDFIIPRRPPNAGGEGFDFETSEPSYRFLPCHYFDYIAGTSTGGYVQHFLQIK